MHMLFLLHMLVFSFNYAHALFDISAALESYHADRRVFPQTDKSFQEIWFMSHIAN